MGKAAVFAATALAFLFAGSRASVERAPAAGVTVMSFREIAEAEAYPLAAAVVGRMIPMRTPIMEPGGTRSPLLGQGFLHQWPGVYATARFHGESLIAAFDDDSNRYRVIFDNGTAHLIDRPGKQAFRFEGLGAGLHHVRLEKMSESIASVGTFVGFFTPFDGGALEPPVARGRQIEFIGDSDLVGYGVAARARDCTEEEVFLSTDTQQTYGPQVARRFGADYQINAYSGIGVIRNHGGAAPEIDMPRLYPRVLFESPALYESEGWAPQIIVSALGTNDFAPPVGPGEPWPDQAALRADFERAYARFITDLRERNPQALLLIAVVEGHGADYEAAVLAVAEAMKEKANGRLDMITFPKLDYRGCHWHPSLKDHATMADVVSGYIELRPELWRAPGAIAGRP